MYFGREGPLVKLMEYIRRQAAILFAQILEIIDVQIKYFSKYLPRRLFICSKPCYRRKSVTVLFIYKIINNLVANPSSRTLYLISFHLLLNYKRENKCFTFQM